MISFSTQEIIISVVYALIWGTVFCAGYSAALLVVNILKSLQSIIKDIFVFDRIFALPDFEKYITHRSAGPVNLFLSIILYTVGFNLISYFSLDGIIRAYMLFISSASFFISKIAFFDFLSKLFGKIISFALGIFSVLCRIAVTPVIVIKNNFNKKRASKLNK